MIYHRRRFSSSRSRIHVSSETTRFEVQLSAEQFFRFIIGIHFLDGFVGRT